MTENLSMNDVPLWRLHLLRAFYLLVTVGLAINFGPSMFQHSDLWAQRKGETAALLSGLAILSIWGLRYPLQMLPLLIFELIWKTVWLAAIAYPLWLNDAITPAVQGTAEACLMGLVLTPLVLPWRHIRHHYFRKPAERFR